MCLIFKKEANAPKITKAWLKDVWSRNNDGWGMLWNRPSTGAIKIQKGLTFPDFWRVFNALQQDPSIEILVHMRMATQGAVDLNNAHPFLVSDTPQYGKIYFMHNGVVSYPEYDLYDKDGVIIEEEDTLTSLGNESSVEDERYWFGYYGSRHNYFASQGKSDTREFVEKFLRPLLASVDNPSEFIRTPHFEWMLSEIGGASNRFTFSDNRGHVLIEKDRWTTTTTDIPVCNTYAFGMDKRPYTYSSNSGTVPMEKGKVYAG